MLRNKRCNFRNKFKENMTVRYIILLSLIGNNLIFKFECVMAFNALQCSKNPGKIFKIKNDFIDCHDNNTKRIELILSKRNVKQYVNDARALKIELLHCKTTHFFFGAKKEKIFTTIPDITQEQYKLILETKSCETEKALKRYKLSTDPICVYTWPKTTVTVVVKCTFTKGIVTTTHNGNMHSNLGNTLSCKYKTGFCLTHDKTAISFTPDPTEEDEFVVVDKFNGTVIGHHLMLPNLGISLKLQNISIGVQIINDFKIDIVQIAQPPILLAPKNLGLSELQVLKNEINAKISFILDKLATPLAEAKVLCEATQINNRLIRSVAQVNPTTLARTILKQNEIVATAGGQNYIIVHPCNVVYNVTWQTTLNSKCSTLIPVNYVNNRQITVQSYFDPLTHGLFSDSPKVTCDQGPDQYFNLGNQTFIYKPGHIPKPVYNEKVQDWPTLRANITDSLIELPESWIYNESNKLDPSDLIWDFLDKRLDELNHSDYDEYDQLAGISILGFLGLSFEHIIDGIITNIFRVFAFLGMLAFFRK